MRFVVADWESLFCSKSGYTLKKMTTEQYVRDARFAAHGVAIKWGPDHAARWYNERQARQVLADEDWSDVLLIHHHAQFDSLIESHHYGVHPKMIGCTLSMARMLLGNHLSVSLDAVRKHFGMPAKRTPYELFDGKYWHELTEHEQHLVAEGACDEVESIWAIFGMLMREFPTSELEVIDMTVKMFTQPVLKADVSLLRKVWENEERRKVDLRSSIRVSESDLQSADKFCELLRGAGVDIAYKDGKANGQVVPRPALAKTDDFMRALLEHEDEYVRALAEARIGAKSTLLQSRAEHLGFMAQRGDLCIYLRYCGAHTTRWSGGDSTNFQNFKRGSDLRRSILAPDGYLLLVIDLRQIEARVADFISGNTAAIEEFRSGRDPYLRNASSFYGYEITSNMLEQRQLGKVIKLQCQYGAGGASIVRSARNGNPPITLTPEQGEAAKGAYRHENKPVVDTWREVGNLFPWIVGGLECEWGPVKIKDRKLWLPNGTRINYDTLEWYTGVNEQTGKQEDGWRWRTRQGWSRIWGSKGFEHIVQSLSRVQLSDGMIRLNRAGFRPVMTSHDDVAVLIKDDGHVDEAVKFCTELVKQEPEWLPGIPLDAEATVGVRYEK